ncbi:hypothetical protein [Clostridium sp. YIM B02506]|uniref:hypothetical protein n=1 Tax=Clostridium sp. YIM B02506 TaxID=2910680 RepID=UPI001EEE7931|nr:hypothetical protein [Clostridium sp. YIM B02506]
MKRNMVSKEKNNEYEEVIKDEKKEYPKAGLFTEGEVTDEVIVKKFDIENLLNDKNIEISNDEKVRTTEEEKIPNNSLEKKKREAFTIQKTFTMRESTAKMLVKLKLEHPNINVRVNVILDRAVRYYYKNVTENELSQVGEI